MDNQSAAQACRTITIVLAGLILICSASLASPPQTFTLHLSNVTESVAITNPCIGPAVGTLTYDGVIHVTVDSDTYHAVVHVNGESYTVPEDPDETPFSGSFSETQSLNVNRNNAVTTFTVTQRASQGMEFHISYLLALTPSGAALSVFNWTCGS